jgi:cell division septum initiation protein DivIVA
MKTTLANLFGLGLLSLGLLSTSCASTSLSSHEIAEPRTRISEAERANASEHPRADQQLDNAIAQYGRAEQLMADGDNEAARRALSRASADAELALEIARLENTKRNAEQTLRRIEELRHENVELKTD